MFIPDETALQTLATISNVSLANGRSKQLLFHCYHCLAGNSETDRLVPIQLTLYVTLTGKGAHSVLVELSNVFCFDDDDEYDDDDDDAK